VFVIQSICTPGNDHLMELLLMLDAFKRASARRITAVVPYYGYARQDRKVAPRVPISAKLVADLITTAGASRVLTVDLHAGQIQGFFDVPVDNVYATPVLLEYLRGRIGRRDVTVISPDAGGVERAARLRQAPGRQPRHHRQAAGAPERGRRDADHRRGGRPVAVIVDDMVDTAGTLSAAAEAVRGAGAPLVLACATHPVLSGPAIPRLAHSSIDELIVTDTIPLRPEATKLAKLRVPLGRAAPRRGDPPHARGGLHQLTLHLKDDRLWTWSRSPSSAARVRARARRASCAGQGSSPPSSTAPSALRASIAVRAEEFERKLSHLEGSHLIRLVNDGGKDADLHDKAVLLREIQRHR